MRLLVVSHTDHYRTDAGVVGWGATVRELDHVASLFDEVVHVAPLHGGPAPAGLLPYRAANVRLRPIAPSGGERLIDKLRILRAYPRYARVLWAEMSRADAVHVRAPANIALLALLLLALRRSPRRRWLKYAGSWRRYRGESRAYALQRWWLAHACRSAVVTVNGSWADQPAHVHTFFNPSFTAAELASARSAAAGKVAPDGAIRVVFVGALTVAKGAPTALDVLLSLRTRGIPAELTFVGDGPARGELERAVAEQGCGDAVRFAGWLPPVEIGAHYAAAHIVLLPSVTEGWPKVLSEGMAHGAVPVASAVGSIAQHLREFGIGAALPVGDAAAMADALAGYVASPDRWALESRRAVEAAGSFGYDRFLSAVRSALDLGRSDRIRSPRPARTTPTPALWR